MDKQAAITMFRATQDRMRAMLDPADIDWVLIWHYGLALKHEEPAKPIAVAVYDATPFPTKARALAHLARFKIKNVMREAPVPMTRQAALEREIASLEKSIQLFQSMPD